MAWATPLIPVWGQFVGGASLLANLPQLWHHASVNTWTSYGFLVVSTALETAGEFPWFDRAVGSAAAFKLRGATDIFAGMSQALLGNYKTRTNKWDVPGLVQSVEYTVGGMFWSRAVAGIGYRPSRLTVRDVEQAAEDGKVNLYKVQLPLGKLPMVTSPTLEWLNLGVYHEGLLAVGTDSRTLGDEYIRLHEFAGQRELKSTWELEKVETIASAKHTTTDKLGFEYIGTFDQDVIEEKFYQGMTQSSREEVQRWFVRPGHYYNLVLNNCQQYADEVIFALQSKQQPVRP